MSTGLAIAGSSLLGGLLGGQGSQKTVSQEPMMTPEQQTAMRSLLNSVTSGGYLGNKNVYDYSGDMGSYGTTGTENQGLASLQKLLSSGVSGNSALFGAGSKGLTDILSTDRYDPFSATGEYAGFKKQTLKDLGESQDRLSQTKAVTGNLYSRDYGTQSRKLQEAGNDTLNNKLASLYSNYVQQKQNAAGTAVSAGLQESQQGQSAINQAMTYGGLERTLADTQAKDKYNAWLEASKSRLSTLSGVAGSNANYGVKDLQYQQTSPWASLFNTGMNLGTNMMGMDYFKTGKLF